LKIQEQSTTVWQAALTTESQQVFLDGTKGTEAATIAAVDAANEWIWDSNILYIYSSGGDPDTEYTTPGIEASQRNYAINVDGKSYLDFENLHVKYTNMHGIYTTNASNNHNYTNITASYNKQNGFWSWDGSDDHRDDYTFTDCTFSYNAAAGLSHVGLTDDWTITRCVFDHNSLDDDVADTGGYRYVAADTSTRGVNIVVTDSVSHTNGTGVSGSRGYGFWLDIPGSGSKITRCLAYDNFQSGIMVEYAYIDTNIEVTYNIAYGNLYGIALYRRSHDVKIYNNVVYNNDYGLVLFGDSATGDADDFDDNMIKNNISYRNVYSNLLAKYGPDNSGDGSGNVYSNNSLGPESDVGVAPTNLVEWGDANYDDTYDNWETAYGGTTNSIESDPLMTDPANDDFTLQSTSPAINAGTDLGDSYDDALDPASSWPSSVITADQDNYCGSGANQWEIGAYVYKSACGGGMGMGMDMDL
jgi:parallel beta-helix repeat protein